MEHVAHRDLGTRPRPALDNVQEQCRVANHETLGLDHSQRPLTATNVQELEEPAPPESPAERGEDLTGRGARRRGGAICSAGDVDQAPKLSGSPSGQRIDQALHQAGLSRARDDERHGHIPDVIGAEGHGKGAAIRTQPEAAAGPHLAPDAEALAAENPDVSVHGAYTHTEAGRQVSGGVSPLTKGIEERWKSLVQSHEPNVMAVADIFWSRARKSDSPRWWTPDPSTLRDCEHFMSVIAERLGGRP